VPHGIVATIEYPSSTLGIVRRAHVYTPPGYEGGNRARYPVLYLVHGSGDSDDSWTAVGHANYILDNLIAAGKATPMIVVMPFGHTPDRPGLERMNNVDFGKDLLTDLIPYVDRHWRTIPKPKDRAMAGLSMGGGHTLNFGLTHPELFGSIGVFSLGINGGTPAAAYVAQNDAALKRRAQAKTLVFYAFGKDDFLFAMSAPTRKIFDDYGIRYTYRESGGGHTWVNWRNYFNEFAPLLFR
jgi:enterochelin esterase-like enzyme